MLVTRILRQAADKQTCSFVLLMNFSNKLKLCVPKPARTQSPKTLVGILKKKMEQKLKQEILHLYKKLKEEDNTKENRLDKWRNLEPESAEFISIIIRTQQSKSVLELGTSNGFSTLWLSDALNKTNGKLVSIEIEKKRTELARNHLINFKLIDNVELLTTDAKDFLFTAKPIYDLIFLDAERKYYVDYWNYLEKLLDKKGSLLIVDNVISHQNDVADFISIIENNKDFIVSTINVGAGILLVTKQ